MAVLTKTKLKEYFNKEKLEERLVITPLLAPEQSLGSTSVDVRLGNELIILRKQTFPHLNVSQGERLPEQISKYQEKIRLNYHKEFVLHPHHFVLGSTFEYVSLPAGLMCYVIGKSSWGRMGLIIATATKVDPGFKGCITLEIINDGEVPLVLYPGIPIAQLVFHYTDGPDKYDGHYTCPTGPQFPNFSGIGDDAGFWYPRG